MTWSDRARWYRDVLEAVLDDPDPGNWRFCRAGEVILVKAIEPSTVACGAAVRPRIWYQLSGGPRWAHMTIKNGRGAVVWHRNASATRSWRYWRFRVLAVRSTS